jgi:hypothetical protein
VSAGVRRAPGALVHPLVAALVATAVGTLAVAAATARQDTLTLEARGWVVAGRPLELRIVPHGPLEGRRLTVTIFVDDERVDDVDLPRAPATFVLPTADLAAGRHRILAKTGSERATLEVRVFPASMGRAVALALLASAAAAFVWRRRRRASGR